MQSFPGIREGHVRLERAGPHIKAVGLNVLGWHDGHAINRDVMIDPMSPTWFWEFCKTIVDTDHQVKVRVVQLKGPKTAIVGPMVKTKIEFEAQEETLLRKGRGEFFTPEQIVKAFEFHTYVALQRGLQVIEHFTDGIRSHTIARCAHSHAEYKLVGGMLVVKALPAYDGDKHKIEYACSILIRCKPYDAFAPQED